MKTPQINETPRISRRPLAIPLALGLCLLFLAAPALASGETTFTDVAAASGVNFQRTPSERYQTMLALYEASLSQPVSMQDFPGAAMHFRGMAGVAVFDYDDDGDLDIYVTNGPGSANSLFQNQLTETGSMSFVDVGQAAGVAIQDRDSGGVCAGDIDNDGDIDLLVTNHNDAHSLFENQGDGTFSDIASSAGLGDGGTGSSSCALGDIDNDGLLDLVIAHGFNYDSMLAIFVEPYALNQPNELFLNLGGNSFQEVADARGLNTNSVLPPGANGISWAVAAVDYDQDGDIDIVVSDDQGAIPPGVGLDRGFNQIFTNDGSGFFTSSAEGSAGSWMGTSFGDFDCDGNIDLFGSNFGDYGLPFMGMPYTLGEQASRVLSGTPGGGFVDAGVGAMVSSAFGWGTSAVDIDNDGDTDVVTVGSLDLLPFVEKSNPGIVALNEGNCSGNLDYDFAALESANHSRRGDVGLATGDLDNDGFVDIVTAANIVMPDPFPIIPFPVFWGAPLDGVASFAPRMAETAPGSGQFVWLGFDFPDGTLTVEMNNGESGFESATITLLGGVGLTPDAGVNRSGIGATLTFTPKDGATTTQPVYSGGSFLSQHSLSQTLGLGDASRGTLDVLWPGGVRNRLHWVRGGETITFPEIPCSYDTGGSFGAYKRCVKSAVRDYVQAGKISFFEAARLSLSAYLAYWEAH